MEWVVLSWEKLKMKGAQILKNNFQKIYSLKTVGQHCGHCQLVLNKFWGV